MELDTYVGFECTVCGTTWSVNTLNVAPTPQCPSCQLPAHDSMIFRVVVADSEIENGVYECFACGHTFSYAAAPNENPESVPDCTQCHSSDVDLMY